MLSYLQSLGVVLGGVLVALCLLLFLNRYLDDDLRRRSNSVNGWQLGIIGSIYAVALGFMLSDAFLAFQTASADARNEAAAALTIYRVSNLLPAACGVPLQSAVRDYVQTVDTIEWATMNGHNAEFKGSPIVRTMWGIVRQCDEHTDLSARGKVISSLEDLQSRRDSRIADYDGNLPAMMWGVLIFGGCIVVASSCLLANEKKSVHCFHVISLTVLISFSLLTIADLDRPFEGATRVSS